MCSFQKVIHLTSYLMGSNGHTLDFKFSIKRVMKIARRDIMATAKYYNIIQMVVLSRGLVFPDIRIYVFSPQTKFQIP